MAAKSLIMLSPGCQLCIPVSQSGVPHFLSLRTFSEIQDAGSIGLTLGVFKLRLC